MITLMNQTKYTSVPEMLGLVRPTSCMIFIYLIKHKIDTDELINALCIVDRISSNAVREFLNFILKKETDEAIRYANAFFIT